VKKEAGNKNTTPKDMILHMLLNIVKKSQPIKYEN